MEALQNKIKQNKPLMLVIFGEKKQKQPNTKQQKTNQKPKRKKKKPFVVSVMFYQRDAEMLLVYCSICNTLGTSPTLWTSMCEPQIQSTQKDNQSMVFAYPHSPLQDRGRKGKGKNGIKSVQASLMLDGQKLNLAATAFQQIFSSCLWLGRKKWHSINQTDSA